MRIKATKGVSTAATAAAAVTLLTLTASGCGAAAPSAAVEEEEEAAAVIVAVVDVAVVAVATFSILPGWFLVLLFTVAPGCRCRVAEVLMFTAHTPGPQIGELDVRLCVYRRCVHKLSMCVRLFVSPSAMCMEVNGINKLFFFFFPFSHARSGFFPQPAFALRIAVRSKSASEL